MAGTDTVHERSGGADPQQPGRAADEAHRVAAKERPLRRLGPRRRNRRDPQQPDQHLPPTRHQPAGVSHATPAGAIRESRVWTEFMKVTRRIGLRDRTCPKDLRHLFATSLQAAGVDPLIRRDLMGHTSLEMTGRYTHSTVETRYTELLGLRILIIR